MLIEQAIFTSTRTDQATGYQLVARSANVCEQDARELSVRGPSHDSLWDASTGTSVNFFALPSGLYCVGRTVAAGSEYSNRGGRRIYTQCLLVPPDDLARFGNNPFALLRAALAQGSLEVHRNVAPRLEPFRLPGRAAVVDEALLLELSAGAAQQVASLMQAILQHDRVGVAAGRQNERYLTGLLNCLPLECRAELSFSTMLSYSPRRPFRLIGLPEDGPELRRAQSKARLPIWRAQPARNGHSAVTHPWAVLTGELLAHGRITPLAKALSRARPGLTLSRLDQLAEELRPQLHSALGEAESIRAAETVSAPTPALLAKMTARLREDSSGSDTWQMWQRTHQACLNGGDQDLTAELVVRACQIFGVRSTPESEHVARIRQLLRDQLQRDPAVFRHTLRCLQTLKSVFNRDFWLQIARGIEYESQQQPGDTASQESPVPRSVAPSAFAVRARAGGSDEAAPRPAMATCRQPSEAIELLEQLDDAVFDAVAGKEGAFETLQQLWPEVLAQLGPEPIEESREQYLRHAIDTWRDCFEGEAARDAQRAARLIEIITLMLGP